MREFKERKKPSTSSDAFFKPTVQTKLTVGEAGDQYEREADATAERVVNGANSQGGDKKSLASDISSVQMKEMAAEEDQSVQKKDEEQEAVQAKEEEEQPVQKKDKEQEAVQAKEEEEQPVQKKDEEQEAVQAKEEEEQPVQKKDEEQEAVQAKETATAPAKTTKKTQSNKPSIESKLNATKGKGNPMQGSVKSEMETGFGTSFNDVNIHTNSNATQMSQDMGALAFTHGKDIYFNSGQYDPYSPEGKVLLAHELTHTIQQEGAESQASGGDQEVEKDAEQSTAGWIGQMLGKGKEVGKKVMPKMKSGLRISRCGNQPTPEQIKKLTPEQIKRREVDKETRQKLTSSGAGSFKDMDKKEGHDNKTFNSYHFMRMMMYREKNWSREGQKKGYGKDDYHDCVTSFGHTFDALYDEPFKTFNYATVEKAKNKKNKYVNGAYEDMKEKGYVSSSKDFTEYTKGGKAGTEDNPSVTHFKESPAQWALDQSTDPGVHVFGVSLNDGFHAMNLIVDTRFGGQPEFYLQDQHKKTDALDRSSPQTAEQIDAYFIRFSNDNHSQKGKRKVKLFKLKRVN